MPPVLRFFLIKDPRISPKPLPAADMSKYKSHIRHRSKLTINLFVRGGEKRGRGKKTMNRIFTFIPPQNKMRKFFPTPELQKIIMRRNY